MGTGKSGRADGASIPTTTHARLRAEQGDVATARRILEAILAERPGDPEAREMLDRLSATVGSEYHEPAEEIPPPPEPVGAADLGARFKAALGASAGSPAGSERRRLEEMLRRIEEMQGERRAR